MRASLQDSISSNLVIFAMSSSSVGGRIKPDDLGRWTLDFGHWILRFWPLILRHVFIDVFQFVIAVFDNGLHHVRFIEHDWFKEHRRHVDLSVINLVLRV